MTDELDIGSGPCMEECAQVGREGYREQAVAECRAYIAAIKKKLGEPPDGCTLVVKANPHDFGTYYSVVARFEDRKGFDYALRAESEAPKTWDEVGMEPPIAGKGRGRL
jgi:hypothetical protein